MTYRVRGSGFLKHMVRNIVGTLLEAGKGNLTPAGIRMMLEPGYAGKAGPRAPARGLYLVDVEFGDSPGVLAEAEASDDDS
jgi:tRNA pseudouridine38-40 synthase